MRKKKKKLRFDRVSFFRNGFEKFKTAQLSLTKTKFPDAHATSSRRRTTNDCVIQMLYGDKHSNIACHTRERSMKVFQKCLLL